jgi:hypothetical protein
MCLNTPTKYEMDTMHTYAFLFQCRISNSPRLPNLRYVPSTDPFHEDLVKTALLDQRGKEWFQDSWSMEQVDERVAWMKAVYEVGV